MENVHFGSAFCVRCLARFTTYEDDAMLGYQLCVWCWGELALDHEPSQAFTPINVNDVNTSDESTHAR